MKRKLFAILLAVAMAMTSFVIATPAAAAAENTEPEPLYEIYYDSVNGNDNNPGTKESPKQWIPQYLYAEPGTAIYIKYGSFYNYRMEIMSSGTAEHPIVISAYGNPDDGLPVINGQQTEDIFHDGVWTWNAAAIKICNVSYVTIENLKITHYNPGNPDDWKTGYYLRDGIWILAENATVKGITLRGLEITKVMGMSITENAGRNNITLNDKVWLSQDSNAAININTWDYGAHPHIEDILIEDCYIHDVNTTGINIQGESDPNELTKNLVIRNNVVNGTGADGIVVGTSDSALVENNIVYNVANPKHGTLNDFHWISSLWIWGCMGVNVIQNNEVAYTNSMGIPSESDSAAFDTDVYSRGDYYWQYNYTHDNIGGFYFSMGEMANADPNGVNYIRYNISVNDGLGSCNSAQLVTRDPTVLANNVFYNDLSGGLKIKADDEKLTFVNNVFYQTNGDAAMFEVEHGALKCFNNVFYGCSSLPNADDGSNSIITDPAALGFAGDIAAVNGKTNPNDDITGWSPEKMQTVTAAFQLTDDSILINAGRNTAGLIPEVDGVTNLGIQMTNGRRDYFGNEFGPTGLPNIGVYETNTPEEGVAAPDAPTDLEAPIITDESISLTWNAKDEDGNLLDAWIYRDGKRIKYLAAANSYTDTGLDDETEYTYRVTAVNNAGVESENVAELTVKTAIAAIVVNVNDTAAENDGHYPSYDGEWINASGASSYENIYMVSEDADAIFTWNIDINTPGYYNVYYWQPTGNMLRTRNAIYTVNHADGASTFSVDQRTSGGQWVLVSTYEFDEGMTAITLENGDSGLLNAGAVRLVYAGTEQAVGEIVKVETKVATTMLKVGESTAVSVIAADALGRAFDVSILNGAKIEYSVSDENVITVEDGVITAVTEGASEVNVKVTINGKVYDEFDPIIIQVGDGFAIAEPITAQNENEMTLTVPVSNFTGKDKQITVIATAYNANKMMVDHEVSDMVILRTMNATTFTVTVDTADAATVEIYIWDTIEGMHPLSHPIPVK